MNDLTILSQALRHSRRTFLLRTASTVAFPLSLAACGGGDHDNTPAAGAGTGSGGTGGTGTGSGTTPIVALTQSKAKGTIALPAGSTVTIANVGNALSANAPAVDGSFDFVSAAESEMFAVAVGPGGKMVLCGLLQAGSATSSTQLSARSTAVCLAYTVLGVGVYLPSTQEQYVEAIQASPTLTVLETAVAAAIVARGEAWLDLTDPALKSALAAMQAALSPTALAGSATMASRSRSQSVAGPASEGAVHTQGMAIDKTARTSGIQVTGDGLGTITLTNSYRRRSYAYIDRVSYQDTYTGAITDSPAIVGTQPMKIDATKSITNTLVTLAQLYAGVKDFYDPVVYDSIPTPLAPSTAALTTYRVTSVGLGVTPGDLALLTADQRSGLLIVCAETFVLDIVVPIFAGILIPIKASSMASFTQTFGVSRFKDLISALAASDDILLNKIVAANRPLGEVLWDTLLTLINSDSFKNAILGFFEDLFTSLKPDADALEHSPINIGAKILLDSISAADLTAQAMDLIVVGLSYAFSDLADRFTIDVTKSQVRLNPQSPQLDPTLVLPTNFTLSVVDSDLTSDDLSYQWSCTCLFGDISDKVNSSTVNGTSFPSSFPNLAYVPRGQALGGDQDVLTGTVYKGHNITPGQASSRVPIGTVSSTISYSVPFTPSSTVLNFDQQQTFSAAISTTLLQSGRTLKYVWTVTGGNGSLAGASTQTTTDPQITYTAGHVSAGTDTLTLQVVDLLGVVLATGSAAVKVLGNIVVGIGPQNPTLAKGATQVFTAYTAGGTLPNGVNYRWQLMGGGSIGPSLVAVTTGPSITYTAAATGAGPDTLSVTVRDADNNALANATTTINIQSDWVGSFMGTLSGPGCLFSSEQIELDIASAGGNDLQVNVNSLPSDASPGGVSAGYLAIYMGGSASGNSIYGPADGNIVMTLQGDTITFTDTSIACHGAVVTRRNF